MRGRHYPQYAPKVLVHRLSHYLIGPLLGCSCSGPGVGMDGKPLGRRPLLARRDGGCFNSTWRIAYSRETTPDRVRLARLEEACRKAGIEVPYGR